MSEPVQRPLDPAAGFVAEVLAPPLHRWQSGPTFTEIERKRFAREIPVGSSSERLVLAMLQTYTDKWAVCWPSLSTLAEVAMVDKSTVTRALRALESNARIQRETPKDRKDRGDRPPPGADPAPWRNSTVYRLLVACG